MRRVAMVGAIAAFGASAARAAGARDVPEIALSPLELLLMGLAFAGVAVGAISTLWGLTQKLSAEDEHGTKRLTREGRIALGLAVGSFLIAGLAASVQLVSANLKKQNDMLAAAAEADRVRAAAEAQARIEDRVFRSAAIAQLNEARRRADSAAARLLALENAAREERRDAELALRVSRGTEANLERTQAALTELGRVLQPLGVPSVQLQWQIRADTPEAAAMLAGLRDLAARARAGETNALEGVGYQAMAPEYARQIKTLVLNRDSPFYPGFDDILRSVVSTRPRGAFFAVKNAATGLAATRVSASDTPGGPLRRKGDLPVEFTAGAPQLIYQIDQQLLVFETVWRPERLQDQTGDLVSIPDLETAIFVVEPGGPYRATRSAERRTKALRLQVRPTRLYMTANGRTFSLGEESFRRVLTDDGYPLYVIDPVGKAGFRIGS